jgi:hypothetical protein
MRIRNFVHKGLKKLSADDVKKSVPPDAVDKVRKMLAFLDDMGGPRRITGAAFLESAYHDR